jgi:hypothetical protein
MIVGVGEITLVIPENNSLKDKRKVLKSIIQRTRNKFNVAMAEVEHQDIVNLSVLGFTVVSNDKRFINSLIDKIFNFIDSLGLAVVRDQSFDIIQY